MKTYRIVWSAAAQDRLLALEEWIVDLAGEDAASAYTDAIVAHVAKLATFPERGTPRDDIAPGLRTTPWRRRTVIAYRVTADSVEIVAIAHGGQMFEMDEEE